MTLSTSGKGSFSNLCEDRTESSPTKVISYARVSAITQEPNENPIPFLERLEEALQKFTNLDLRLLRGTGDFKGQTPVPVCIRYQN